MGCAMILSSPMQQVVTDTNEQIIDELLASKRTPATRAAYRSDLTDLSRFLEGFPSCRTLEQFVSLPEDAIQRTTHAYKQSLVDRGVAIATINRRLAAVRALLAFASERGLAATDARALVRNHR